MHARQGDGQDRIAQRPELERAGLTLARAPRDGQAPRGASEGEHALVPLARGAAPADLYVRGGSLLNVYTGEIYPAGVAVKGRRIAYVGLREDMIGSRTRVIGTTDTRRCARTWTCRSKRGSTTAP